MTKLKVILVTIALSLTLVVPAAEASPATDGLSRLYCAYFDRAPDPGGRVYWESMIAGGMVLDQVADVFADSPEYWLLYGNTSNTIFVARMYTNIMGRDLDVGGHAYWLELLDAGLVNRGELMVQFSESREYQTVVYPTKSKCDAPEPLSPSPTTPTTPPTGSLKVNSVSTTSAVIYANLSECASVSWSISPGGLSASSGTCDNPHLMDTSRAGALSPNTTYMFTANFTTANNVPFRRTITFTTTANPHPAYPVRTKPFVTEPGKDYDPNDANQFPPLRGEPYETAWDILTWMARGHFGDPVELPYIREEYDQQSSEMREQTIRRDEQSGFIFSWYDAKWVACSATDCPSSAAQKDHVVDLYEAHLSGAWRWTEERKVAFSTDLDNLIMVSAESNQAKSDKDPAEWMPSNKLFWCEYLDMWVALKYKWGLALDADEQSAIIQHLGEASCPSRR